MNGLHPDKIPSVQPNVPATGTGVIAELDVFMTDCFASAEPEKRSCGLAIAHSLAHGDKWRFNYSLARLPTGVVVILRPRIVPLKESFEPIAPGPETLELMRPYVEQVATILREHQHEDPNDINSIHGAAAHLLAHMYDYGARQAAEKHGFQICALNRGGADNK